MIDSQVTAVLDRLYAEDAAQRAANLPPALRTRNLERDTGAWLHLLLIAAGARAIFEIGSSNGVSTIWLAAAARTTGGLVSGAEILPARAAAANIHLSETGLARWGRVHAGDAAEIVATLPGPFDAVFIDAEKDDYVEHFASVVDRVRGGGLILADNVISHDLSGYQQLLRDRSDVETTTVPIGRGIEFTVKMT